MSTIQPTKSLCYTQGMDAYISQQNAADYQKFLNSESGKMQREHILKAVRSRLKNDKEQTILDAGCSSGWLAGALSSDFPRIKAFDGSPPLIDIAKKQFPHIPFLVAHLNKPLPYTENKFDVVLLSMVSQALIDPNIGFTNVTKVLKQGGKLIFITANPYYANPVASWKRGLKGFLLRQKPRLLVGEYNRMKNKKNRDYTWTNSLNTHFYTLSEQINYFLELGLQLTYFYEFESSKDSENFNLNYQLYRYPLLLMLEFHKP